jgi:hypothetical protein
MLIKRSKLISKLRKVLPALGTNVLVPAFQCFQFKDGILTTTDGAMVVQTELGDADFKINCAIPGIPFLSLLDNLTGEDVDIIYSEENSNIIVKNARGTVKGTLVTNTQNLPLDVPVLQQEMFSTKEKISQLLEGLGFCRYNVSKDSTTGPLCGLHIKGENIYSTDRFRIMRYTFAKDPILGACCTFPVKFVNALLKVKDEITNIGVEENTVLVTLEDNTKIWSGLLLGNYVDIDPFIPADISAFSTIRFPEKIKSMLVKHIDFLKDVDPVDKDMKISLSKEGKCRFISIDKNLGILEEEVDTNSVIPEDIEFIVNPLFLEDISTICSEFFYKDGLVVFKTEKLTYLVNAKK